MKYLLPTGGIVDPAFGLIVTPSMRGTPQGILEGISWAADNQAFTQGFDPSVFFPWLETFTKYRNTCIFVSCPDHLGNASQTLELFYKWQPKLAGWPVAFVAQDGQERLPLPPPETWDCLFIGGTTHWKMSSHAVKLIRQAIHLGKHIHIGRVNYYRRYQHFASLEGSENFTCDGTRIRYERDKAIRTWKQYMTARKQYRLEYPE